jgi:hypothetical protein
MSLIGFERQDSVQDRDEGSFGGTSHNDFCSPILLTKEYKIAPNKIFKSHASGNIWDEPFHLLLSKSSWLIAFELKHLPDIFHTLFLRNGCKAKRIYL